MRRAPPPSWSRRTLVTGGTGFIGSALLRRLLDEGHQVLNLDKPTDAANPRSLQEIDEHPRCASASVDICEPDQVAAAVGRFRPQSIVHLAAETHVDRSLVDPGRAVRTNLLGTFNMLSAALDHWRSLDSNARSGFRFVQVSTDEVFGQLGHAGTFSESSPYRPRSPYAASKAGADHLARAWHHSFGLPVSVTHCSNNYGPRQAPEKLIPLTIVRALAGERLPVYGRGENVRNWLHVDDHVAGLVAVLDRGQAGESYLMGGHAERRNIDVVQAICESLDRLQPRACGSSYSELIGFVPDRPGHDFRYSADTSKIERELGWRPLRDFDSALQDTVAWYVNNVGWWASMRAKALRPVGQ